MSPGMKGSRRIHSLQTARKRLALRNPFITSNIANVVTHNAHGTLVDDVLLKILSLCDISTVLSVSRVRLREISTSS